MHTGLLIMAVLASIVASAPTYASGSCLSYGHSCWGAHGKRSDEGLPVSKLGLTERQARLAEYLLAQQLALRYQRGEGVERGGEPGEEDGRETDRLTPVEQPPRLYQILSQLSRNYGKNQLQNN